MTMDLPAWYDGKTINDTFFAKNGRVNRLEPTEKGDALSALSSKSFCSFLKQNERTYNLEYTNKVHVGNGRFVRGFMGIEVLYRDHEIL